MYVQPQQNYGYQNPLAQPVLHRPTGSMQQGLSSQQYGFPNQPVPIQHMPVPQPTPVMQPAKVTHQAPAPSVASTAVQSALAQPQLVQQTNQLPTPTQQAGMAQEPSSLVKQPTLTQLAMATSALQQSAQLPTTPIPAPPAHVQQAPASQPAVAQTSAVQPAIPVPTPQPPVTAAPEAGLKKDQPLATPLQDPLKIAEENRRCRKRNRERVRRSEIGEQFDILRQLLAFTSSKVEKTVVLTQAVQEITDLKQETMQLSLQVNQLVGNLYLSGGLSGLLSKQPKLGEAESSNTPQDTPTQDMTKALNPEIETMTSGL